MLFRFFNSDSDNENWCKENRDGYVFNNFGGNVNRADMNKVPKVNCIFLWRKIDEGKRTIKYEKVCSFDFEQLIDFIKTERGDSWTFCQSKYCFEDSTKS